MTILWSITNKDGSPFPLAGKEVHLYYTCERGRYEAAIEIQDNVVSWEFLASRQKALGGYTLTLEVLQSDGKRALKRDLCDAFVLVGKNCEEKFDHDGAHIEEGGIVNLVTSLEVYRVSPIIPYVVRDENGIGYWYVDGVNTGDRSTGESAYEYAKKKGYEGTEEEFAELQAGIPTLILDYENYKEQSAEGFASLGRQINALDQNKVSASDIDSALSTTSTNPVQNKVVTEELNKKAPIEALTTLGESVANSITSLEEKKANKTDVAQSDWNASKQEKGHILNRTHYVDLTYFEHLTINKNDFDLSFDGSYWIAEYKTLLNEEQLFVYCSAKGKEFYSPIGDSEIKLPNSIYVKRIDVYSDDGDFVGIKLVVRNGSIDEEFRGESFYIADIWSYPHIKELSSIYIPDTIARTEQVDEVREETTALWENLDHGVFPNLVSGDLAGRGESVPAEFGFRASGGKSIKDGRAYIKRIKGNSVVWNQTATISGLNSTFSKNGDKYVATPTSTPSTPGNMASSSGRLRLLPNCVVNHVYLYDFGFTRLSKREDIDDFTPTNMAVLIGSKSLFYDANIGEKKHINGISTAQDTSYIAVSLNDCVCEIDSPIIIDLTQMFGSGNEPSTIEEFNARVATLGVDLYAYNDGEVIHCNTESIKSVGDNAWDEEWESGRFNTNTGEPNPASGIRTKNPIKVLPNQSYWCLANNNIFALFWDSEGNLIEKVYYENNYLPIKDKQFTTPANADYMVFYVPDIIAYNHDIMITLVHSGWKQDTDAGYQPYWQDTLPLPIINKYFPDGMKKAGSTHDEIRYNKASGKWEAVQRIGSVDMGSMAWSYDSANQVFTSYTIMDLMTHPAEVSERAMGLLCAKYSPSRTYVAQTMDDKSWLRIPKSVTIKDTSYTDAATFKAAMQGVMLYYEAAEWEWVELDAEDQNFRDYYNVADFGTEQSQSSVPSAAFSADIIYQFNAVDTIREHEIEIQKLKQGGSSYDDTAIKNQLANKADTSYVNSAIANAITNTLNTEV